MKKCGSFKSFGFIYIYIYIYRFVSVFIFLIRLSLGKKKKYWGTILFIISCVGYGITQRSEERRVGKEC